MTATTIYCIIVRLYIIAIAADWRRLFDTTLNAHCRRPTTTPTTANLDNRRATLLCAALYSRPMATATNRNSGMAVKINITCRVGGTATLQMHKLYRTALELQSKPTDLARETSNCTTGSFVCWRGCKHEVTSCKRRNEHANKLGGGGGNNTLLAGYRRVM